MDKTNWRLQPSVMMDDALAMEVAKIACALKSLSVYTAEALEEDDTPDQLKTIVDDGMEAMKRVFVW